MPVSPSSLLIRPLSPTDSLEELTDLIHRAYKRLGDMGLKFVGTYQDVETTRKRANSGECFVGVLDCRIVATITITPPGRDTFPDWYARPDVAMFGQFAVEPELQSAGIGGAMMNHVEQRAREIGAAEIALDTSEQATHLIDYYERRGYRFIQHVQWDVTNYRSVIMSKHLPGMKDEG